MAVTITSMGSCRSSISLTGTFNKTNTGFTDDGTGVTGSVALNRSTTYTYGTSAVDTINQAATYIFTATMNTTTQMDLSGAITNLVGDTASTVTVIRWLLFELLSTTQDATNGTAATSVAIQPGSSSAITTSPLGSGATNSYTMENGDKWLIEKHNAGGITVTGGSADNFAVINNDANDDAKLRITLLGNA